MKQELTLKGKKNGVVTDLLKNKNKNKNKFTYERRKQNLKNRIVISNDSGDESDDNDIMQHNLFGTETSVECVDNRIYFRAKVCADSVASLIRIINRKNKEYELLQQHSLIKSMKPKPLYLHITSYGGCLFSGFRAIDAIKRSVIPIYTVIDGPAASAATLMSVVGKKRYMTPHSYMLIHQLSSGVIGKYFEMKDEFNNCKLLMEDIYSIYIDNSKMTRTDLEGKLLHDSWWNADKCIKFGLIDGILE